MTRLPLCYLALVVLTWSFSAEARAQAHEMRDLTEGDTVRLRMPGSLLVDASMIGFRGDTLLLRVEGLDDPWRVSHIDLLTLEQHTARNKSEGFRNGATLGLATGFFLGAVAGVVVGLTSERGDQADPNGAVMGRALKWGAIGAAAGGLGGGFYGGAHPGRGWVMLELPYR